MMAQERGLEQAEAQAEEEAALKKGWLGSTAARLRNTAPHLNRLFTRFSSSSTTSCRHVTPTTAA